MAYFLKKRITKKGLYLQIYENFYDPERGHAAHKSYKPIGYVHELQAKGIDDPISYYKEEVAKLNQKLKAAKDSSKTKQISEESPEKLIGYFPLKNINDRLSVKKCIDLMQTATDFRFKYNPLPPGQHSPPVSLEPVPRHTLPGQTILPTMHLTIPSSRERECITLSIWALIPLITNQSTPSFIFFFYRSFNNPLVQSFTLKFILSTSFLRI